MHTRHLPALAALSVALAAIGCTSDDNHDFDAAATERAEQAAANPGVEVGFDPANGVLPFPNDVFFAGSEDGTLNLPVADANDLGDPRVALNQMDGFSTTAPITATVSGALDPASLTLGENIRVFEYTTDAEGAVALGTELGPDRLVAVQQGDTLALLPTTPLAPSTRHAIYLTTGITDTRGEPLGTPGAYTFVRGGTPLSADNPALVAFNPALPQLEPLRQATRPLIEAIGARPSGDSVAVGDVALAWSVTTQSIREVLEAGAALSGSSSLQLTPSGLTTSEVPGGTGVADIWIGGLSLPYYQVDADSPTEFLDVLSGFWQTESGAVVTGRQPTPAQRSVERVPVLMTVPNASGPAGGTVPEAGWPVVIFQHGITRNRTDMLAVAEAMAAAGIVTIAIDMPVHGLTDPANPFHAGGNPFAEGERTFDIDVVTIGEDGAVVPGPDGNPDPSGQHFYSPANLANSRDNLRQASVDLVSLSASLASAQVIGADGSSTPFAFDVTRKGLLGHSLGGIVGVNFLSVDDSIASATLAMPGGGIAQLLANSEAFGPTIRDGFTAANGGEFDPAAFASFLLIAQTVIDSGDPVNHARTVAGLGTGVHLLEVIGEAPSFDSDQVIPNAVFGAPLAGTEPLARELGLSATAASTTGNALVRFSRGNHGSIINPLAPVEAPSAEEQATALAVTTEMQRQTVMFAASGGQAVSIENTDVIAPVDARIVPAGAPEGSATD